MKQLMKKFLKGTIPNSIKNKLISIISRIVSEQINLHIENIYQKLASLEKVEYKVKELEQGIERYEQKLASLEKVEYKVKGFEQSIERYEQKLASLEKVEYKVKGFEQSIERYEQKLASLEKVECRLKNFFASNVMLEDDQSVENIDGVLSDDEYDRLEKQICRGRKIVEKDYFDSLSENFPLKAKILDLGCGDGSFIKQMNKKGFLAEGIDANTQYANEPNVILGLLPEALHNIPDNSYDIVASFHLIEHLPLKKYKEMVKEVHRVLKRGGKVFFETPNTQSLITMSQYYYKDPTHLMPRHPEVYLNILNFNGFKNTEIKNLPELDTSVFELISEKDSLSDERSLSIVNKNISQIENILVAGSGNILIVGEK